jgi:hypothetical protein
MSQKTKPMLCRLPAAEIIASVYFLSPSPLFSFQLLIFNPPERGYTSYHKQSEKAFSSLVTRDDDDDDDSYDDDDDDVDDDDDDVEEERIQSEEYNRYKKMQDTHPSCYRMRQKTT